jgi:hypothetical protein
VVWPHDPEQLQKFFSHLNSLRPAIQFTTEIESDSAIPFLDVPVIRKEMTLATKVYRKPTHTGQHLNFNSNHPLHVEKSLIQSLLKRAFIICQGLCNEISTLRHDLQLNGYPGGFTDSAINSKGRSCPSEVKSLGTVYIPYVKGVSEKFKCIENRYNIRTIFRTKHNVRSSLKKTRPERYLQQMAESFIAFPLNVVEVTLVKQADL